MAIQTPKHQAPAIADAAPAPVEQRALATVQQARSITITTEQSYVDACEFLKKIAQAVKDVEAFFAPMKKSAHEAWKQVCAKESGVLGPLTDAKTFLGRQISVYQTDQERKRREEEQRLREIARQEQEVRDKAAREAEEAAALLADSGDAEIAAEIVQESAAANSVPVVVPIVPVTTPRMEGISSRVNWKYRIVNAAIVPREYLMLDERKIGSVVRAMKDTTNIPGIEVYAEDSVSVRA